MCFDPSLGSGESELITTQPSVFPNFGDDCGSHYTDKDNDGVDDGDDDYDDENDCYNNF